MTIPNTPKPMKTHNELLQAYQTGKATLPVDHINHREFVMDGTRYFCGYSSQACVNGEVQGWITYKTEPPATPAPAPETPQTESRGNPDGPDIHSNELELVHYRVPSTKAGTLEDRPACNNGAFNIRWTKDRNAVTCPKCRQCYPQWTAPAKPSAPKPPSSPGSKHTPEQVPELIRRALEQDYIPKHEIMILGFALKKVRQELAETAAERDRLATRLSHADEAVKEIARERDRLKDDVAKLQLALKAVDASRSELLAACKGLVAEVHLGKLNVRKDFSLMNAHACATKAIASVVNSNSPSPL